MKPLSSNTALYEYLKSLSVELNRRGLTQLSEVVDFAIAQASSGFPSEFLGESRIALRRIINEEHGDLTSEERATLADVLAQIDEALNGNSGA